jgi:hypothetical protein
MVDVRLFFLSLSLLALAACGGANTTEKRLREVEARAEAAEKKLAAIEQKVAPTPAAPEPAAPAPTPAPAQITPAPATSKPARILPAGSLIVIRTTSLLSTKSAQPNTTFVAHLEKPLLANGAVIAPRGAQVTGIITASDAGGRVKGRASLAITLTSLTDAAGHTHRIATSTRSQVARSGVKGDAVKTGVASGIGAAIGAIAGGGKGAAIGAGAGAGAGGGVVLATRGPAAEFAPESVLQFTLARSLRIP